jgi:uncharacterized protein
VPRRLPALALLAVLLPFAGCGGGGGDPGALRERVEAEVREQRERLEQRVEERLERAQAEARSVGRRLADRVREQLEQLEQVVPRATEATEAPTVQGREGPQRIDAFLTEVLTDLDGFWTRTLAAAGLPEPTVRYSWVPPGRRAFSRCGAAADDRSAFYCPADDTIYIGQVLAAELYEGIARGFPGERVGRAVGDFGVAYIVAHEYAHNLQDELGFLTRRRGASARPFELQADCLAGTWGASVYRAGRLQPGDVEEALGTALAVGDFEVGSPEHHGTPEQRRDAWLLGFDAGDPSVCRAFVRA